MAGRFEGLSDAEWKIFEDIFARKARRGRGRPAVSSRMILNSLLYILITGSRQCDLPRGPLRATKSSGHRRLKAWHDDGTLNEVKAGLLGLAENKGLIRQDSGAVDGSFSPWQGRRS